MTRKLLKIVLIALITCSIVVASPIFPSIFFSSEVVAQTNKARRAQADRLYNQGNQQYRKSQYREALQSWENALKIYREIGYRLGEVYSLNNLGIAYYSLGQYQKALKSHQQALTIAREIGDRQWEAGALGNLGNAYYSLGQYQQALESHQQHLAIAREIGDRQGEAKSLGNLGIAYYSLGQYQKALESHQQALTIAREIGDRQWEAGTMGNLGNVHYSLGQYAQASEYYQQSLAIKREIGDRGGEAYSLGNLGNAYASLGQYQKAIEYYQQSLAIAREIGNRGGEAAPLNNLGIAYRSLGQYQQALEFHQQALTIAREIGDRKEEANSLNNLGLTYINLKQYTEAEKALYNSLEVLESLRVELPDAAKISIFETQVGSYLLLQYALIAQNKTQQAIEISERGRARAFVELLASKQTDNPEKIKPITLTEIQQVAQEQNATLVEYSLVFDTLYIWVIKPSGEIVFRQTNSPSPNLPLTALVETGREAIGIRGGIQIRERLFLSGDRVKLKDDAENGFQEPWQVVNYDATNNLLTLTHPTFDGGATISRPISDVAEKVISAPISKKPLQDLYKLLIDPIVDQLPTNSDENIIFISHSELFLVPFVALQDEQGKYLIEKYTILTAPAIQVLQLTHNQRPNVKTLHATSLHPENALIVGNPTMPIIPLTDPPERLIPLPNAEREAKTIAKLLNTTPILGKEATKANILPKMPTAGIIHLATHGLLDDIKQLGTPGVIALAPDPPLSPLQGGELKDDGFLSAAEIFNMKLKADLVVLSACNTGQGNITGDGVVGLSRSLMTAGASSVIVSLWSVPDAPTADLMTQFYQNRQKMNKAQALRQAMLTTMKQHPEPKNWAAFTLLGEAR